VTHVSQILTPLGTTRSRKSAASPAAWRSARVWPQPATSLEVAAGEEFSDVLQQPLAGLQGEGLRIEESRANAAPCTLNHKSSKARALWQRKSKRAVTSPTAVLQRRVMSCAAAQCFGRKREGGSDERLHGFDGIAKSHTSTPQSFRRPQPPRLRWPPPHLQPPKSLLS
jgi:hypothetical protein